MKFIYWLLKKKFFILVLSIFLLAFSISYLIRATLIQFFVAENIYLPKLGSASIKKVISSKSSLALEKMEELVEGNLIRGSNAVVIEHDKAQGKDTDQSLAVDPQIASVLVTGTVSGNQSFARVVLQQKDKEEAEEYKVGQKLVEFRILRIDEHSITLGRATSSFKVEVGETIQDAMNKRLPTLGSLNSVNPIKEGTATLHKPTTISRTDIDRILKNPVHIYENARFAPNLVDGKIDGMKIYQVASTHIFYQLGAKSGDIVKRVNGMPLGETEKMLEVWNAVKVSQKIQVDLDRKGEIHTYTFLVRN